MSYRPEHSAPPEIYYGDNEARKYTTNSHIRTIQVEMCERALEMLLLSKDETNFILDIGCGSGISGNVLAENNNFWIGVDISPSMLNEALLNGSDSEGDLVLCDIGAKMGFRNHSFDGAISISALQWLCVANKSSEDPYKRLVTFFKWLYMCLNFNARAAIQFYPENEHQLEMILSAASKCSFGGGLVVDFPNSTKAKKYYLCIWPGVTGLPQHLPQALVDEQEEEEQVSVLKDVRRRKKGKRMSLREKIIQKKEQQRRRGIETRPDTRYTGRKRPTSF